MVSVEQRPLVAQVLFISSLLGTAGILILDLAIPIGTSIWMLYLVLVLLSLWTKSRFHPFLIAFMSTLFILTGLMSHWQNDIPLYVFYNRILGILILWLVAFLCRGKIINEIEIDNYSRQLNQLIRERDKLISVIAHDLRAPFQALIGYSNILLEDYTDMPVKELLDIAKRINTLSKNSIEMLENLLDWTHLQFNKVDAQRTRFNLCKATEKVLLISTKYAFLKDISVENQVVPDLHATGSEQLFSTVLRNLLSNAIKYTPSGGKITISTIASDGVIRVSVTDTGLGIGAGSLQNLFTTTENISTPGTNMEKGTGLGLVLCKEFTERNGGTISAESEVGKGSVFTFTIPAAV